MNPPAFNLGDSVWYMRNNIATYERIIAIKCVERMDGLRAIGSNYLGVTGIWYETQHGIFSQRQVFSDREGLVASL